MHEFPWGEFPFEDLRATGFLSDGRERDLDPAVSGERTYKRITKEGGARLAGGGSDRAEFLDRDAADQKVRLGHNGFRRSTWKNANRSIFPGSLGFTECAVRHGADFLVVDRIRIILVPGECCPTD